MKVAYLLGSLNRGGTETLLLDVFNQSIYSPFKIIGVYRKDGELSDSFHATKVPLFKIEPGSVLFFWHYLWRLRKLLKHEKPEIVHTQQNLDTIYARMACIGLPVKVVQTFHGYDFDTGRSHKLLIHFSLKIADINIFVSESQRSYYTSSYKAMNLAKNAVVYNGVDFSKMNNIHNNSLRAELDIDKRKLIMGMVGNFVTVRDQMTVCRFLSLLNNTNIEFAFLFIGGKDNSNPQIFEDCRYFCHNIGLTGKVLFLGSRSDIPVILPQLDAFIYSTDHDTFGLAVIEAIVSAIPVFINDNGVMKEITEEGKRAIMYRTKDEKDMLNKFLAWKAHPEAYNNSLVENAAWARKTFSIQNHIMRLYELYQEICKSIL